MKKITFILIALISGTAFAQIETSGTAEVKAKIVSPITISENGGVLNFGSINGTSTGGTVSVDFAGDRTFSNDDMKIIANEGEITAANFDIEAANGYVYTISIPAITLDGSGDAMTVAFTHSLDGETDSETATGSGEPQELIVGGELTVNNSQASGAYSGQVYVTVAYQ